jgi:hypothetical protein
MALYAFAQPLDGRIALLGFTCLQLTGLLYGFGNLGYEFLRVGAGLGAEHMLCHCGHGSYCYGVGRDERA